MCDFFSAIATRDGRLFFTEEDSHETIIARAKLRDTDRHLRYWIRVEVTPVGNGWGPVRVDESEVPGWWGEDRAAREDTVLALANRVRAARAAYEAVQQQAWAAYLAVVQPALAAYEAVQQQALAAYEAVQQPALAAYDAVQQQAWAAYEAVQQQAWAAYVDSLYWILGYQRKREAR
jgi:hypothetical protein